MRLWTVSWLLLFSLNVAFGQQNQDKIDWQPWSDSAFARAKKEGVLSYSISVLCGG
jgi:hypothetical protein